MSKSESPKEPEQPLVVVLKKVLVAKTNLVEEGNSVVLVALVAVFYHSGYTGFSNDESSCGCSESYNDFGNYKNSVFKFWTDEAWTLWRKEHWPYGVGGQYFAKLQKPRWLWMVQQQKYLQQ